ncbi:hypothetical protein SVAN01_05039 [Stagonosporopsis vannaccii]|nr:hypothetical protein SVAN01_05039 [Stagonosporopsis vannaccii]
MTPRTRTSNKDASYKVYYSKKVPQQVRFPHKRKTVRRPEQSGRDESEKRQLEFLPERLRQQRDEDEETLQSTPRNRRRGAKRKEKDFEEAPCSDRELETISSKRRRWTTVPKEEPSRTLRRQSTMTQLADGRRPSIDADGPDLKLVKRRPRVSWSGTGDTERGRDKKQRTLTQMVPGMERLSKGELQELSDSDADLEDEATNKDAVSQTLIEQGLLQADAPTHLVVSGQLFDDVGDDIVKSEEAEQRGTPARPYTQYSVDVQSVEGTMEGDDEEDYHPTQFIDAPTLRTRQTSRRAAVNKISNEVIEPGKSAKSRFSLLSTPEKRRVFEIPSSQSPAESVVSTQNSPETFRRSALRERDSNMTIVAETPSKRRQVTFAGFAVQAAPPARLRRFESTILDSEDEGESDLESNVTPRDSVDLKGQALRGNPVGAVTQGRNGLIRSNEAANTLPDSQASSEGTDEFMVRRKPYQPSPELGESWAPLIFDDDGPGFGTYHASWRGAKSQSQTCQDADSSKVSRPEFDHTGVVSQMDLTTQAPVLTEHIPSTPPMVQPQPNEDCPSTPMVLRDDSTDDNEAGPKSSPPHTVRRAVHELPSTLIHQSTDLDGEPVQVPRSPSAERETQQSHSSRAEQQLQREWLSYSQYVHGRVPNSSSMHAAVDTFSYNATPRSSKTVAASSLARAQPSQATTVDEVTPKKNRTQRVVSANTTPHRSSKSQLFISPEKPPSLFIPSSFPSPSRAAMDGWSSPVAGRTQNVYGSSQVMGSLEDFSIPLPPPPIEED